MYNVLIVDDEKEIRNGLKLKIEWEKLGFHVQGEASNGIEALELLRSQPFHLLITDIRMPFMDGLTLLQNCALEFPHLKTIILSGHDDFSYLKSAIQFRARDYLLKPIVRRDRKSVV